MKTKKKYDKTLFEGVLQELTNGVIRISTIASHLKISVFAVNSEINRLKQVRHFNTLIRWDKLKDYVELCAEFKGTPVKALMFIVRLWYKEDLSSGKKYTQLEKDTMQTAGVLSMDYSELDKLMEEDK